MDISVTQKVTRHEKETTTEQNFLPNPKTTVFITSKQ